MTFVEAAVQILRREGKPLHVKELTRLAIKHNLLSVVGRDPEAMMETRLLIEAKRPSADLVRVSPGIFGLRTYPLRNERGEAVKAEGEKVSKPKAEASGTPAKDHRGGKRRRSGRGAEGGEPATPEVKANVASEAVAPKVAVEPAAAPPTPSSEPAASEAKPAAKGRRRTRGGDSARKAEAPPPASAPTDQVPVVPAPVTPTPVAVATPTAAPSTKTPVPPSIPVAAAIPPAPAPIAPAVPVAAPTASSMTPTPMIALPSHAPSGHTPAPSAKSPVPVPTASPAPVAAPAKETPAQAAPEPARPAAPTSAVFPVPQERRPVEAAAAPKPETHAPRADRPAGGPPREDKPNHREDRSHGHPREREDRAHSAPREDRPAPSSATPAPGNQGQSQPQQPRQMTLADAAYDVMRGASDGRALTHRQIAEIAVKRRLVRGELVDVSRAMRVALVREQRHRDSEGLRPRIRSVGPGQYVLGERKLEPELYNAERELLDRASRTREATRVALRRRIRQLPPGAFELLMRLLLERMGLVGPEIVKRGEGVAYYGGTLSRGGRSLKVLIAVRPGEGELSREAVGELRAGVRLRGFDEGMVLCAARAGAAAVAEISASPGLELYDQDALTELLIRQHLGVRRMHLPVDYLDTELFNELVDQT